MRKKSFLWLSFLAVFTLMVHSCRNDYLPERSETYSNSSEFQLTSQRISLSQSKHKAKLLPELEKVEAQFKAKTGALGKVVNYGNGVSIDTDDVIYIENGSNFHTYTFSIQNENTLPNDPIINLVLIPTTDGAYREMLITYHLTAQEKETLQNGGFVDTKEKFTITIPEENIFNPSSSKSGQSCVWMEAIVGYTPCSAEQHFNGELCDAKRKSQPIKEFFLKCTSISDGSEGGGGWEYGPGGGGEGGGGGGSQEPGDSTTEPCNGNGVATGPLDPNTNLGEGGCSGIPTVISLPPRNNPREKVKKIVNNPELKIKIDSLKQFSLTAEENEKGYHQDKSGNVTPATVNGAHYVEFIIDQNSLGGIHCHTLNGPHMFSPKDILTFLSFARMQNYTLPVGSTADNTGNAFLGMIAQSGSYFITFNGGSGDLPPPMTQAEEDAYETEMNEAYKTYVDKLLKEEQKSSGDALTQQGLQKLFFAIIKKMGLEGKINLIKQDTDSTSTIQQNADGTIKEPIPC